MRASAGKIAAVLARRRLAEGVSDRIRAARAVRAASRSRRAQFDLLVTGPRRMPPFAVLRVGDQLRLAEFWRSGACVSRPPQHLLCLAADLVVEVGQLRAQRHVGADGCRAASSRDRRWSGLELDLPFAQPLDELGGQNFREQRSSEAPLASAARTLWGRRFRPRRGRRAPRATARSTAPTAAAWPALNCSARSRGPTASR